MPTCRSCGKSAPDVAFYYHSRAQKYYDDCTTCWNLHRRQKHDAIKQGRLSAPTQRCLSCGRDKPTAEFLTAPGSARLHRRCVDCREWARDLQDGIALSPLEIIERELFPLTGARTPEQRELVISTCKQRLGLPD